jgi:hypothetical protein
MKILTIVADAASSFLNGVTNTTGGTNQSKDVPSLISTVVQVAMYIVGFLAVIMIIAGGIQYATAAGDEAKTAKAKKWIIGGVVGLILAVLATAMVSVIKMVAPPS